MISYEAKKKNWDVLLANGCTTQEKYDKMMKEAKKLEKKKNEKKEPKQSFLGWWCSYIIAVSTDFASCYCSLGWYGIIRLDHEERYLWSRRLIKNFPLLAGA